jgi:hypothetical protein
MPQAIGPRDELVEIEFAGTPMTVTRGTLGYFAPSIQRLREAEMEKQDRVNMSEVVPGWQSMGMADLQVSPDTAARFVQSMMDGNTIEGAMIQEYRLSGRTDKLEEMLQARQAAKAKEVEASWWRAKADYQRSLKSGGGQGPGWKPKRINPILFERDAAKMAADLDEGGSGGVRSYASSVGFDLDDENLKPEDREHIAMNHMLDIFRDVPEYKDWADEQIQSRGLWYKGHILKGNYPSIRAQLSRILDKELKKETSEVEREVKRVMAKGSSKFPGMREAGVLFTPIAEVYQSDPEKYKSMLEKKKQKEMDRFLGRHFDYEHLVTVDAEEAAKAARANAATPEAANSEKVNAAREGYF